MYGADGLPTISPRLLFSMTIVNTVPVHAGAVTICVAVSGEHVCDVLPEVFMQPAIASDPPRTRNSFDIVAQRALTRVRRQARIVCDSSLVVDQRFELRDRLVEDRSDLRDVLASQAAASRRPAKPARESAYTFCHILRGVCAVI